MSVPGKKACSCMTNGLRKAWLLCLIILVKEGLSLCANTSDGGVVCTCQSLLKRCGLGALLVFCTGGVALEYPSQ